MNASRALAPLTVQIEQRLAVLQKRIVGAAERAGRNPAEVTVVAVSKRQPANQVAAGVLAGIADLGENYLQEAREKRTRVTEHLGESSRGGVRWHMIGHLQQNKAAAAALAFDTIHSVDRPRLARALDRHAAAADRRIDILLQLNLSGETQKSGIPAAEVTELADVCASLPHLRLTGLMTVPAPNPDPEASRPVFRRLRELRDELHQRSGCETLRDLSMGMSADFEVAIEEGATLVRVGTAIFGPREDAE